jgi:tight adherence protein C
MTGLLAAGAAVLVIAAGRELAGSRSDEIAAMVERGWRRFQRSGAAGQAVAALGVGIGQRLRRAGLEHRLSPATVLVTKGAGVVAGIAGALILAPSAPGRSALIVAIALPAGGFVAPDALLERVARRRHAQLVRALPDALDLMAAGLVAGRSPAAALEAVTGHGAGPLAAELRACLVEVSFGTPATEALTAMRDRLGGSELGGVVAAVARSQRYGAPLADQLREQASALRRDQGRLIEEQAARAAPKIQLVVALVLVPSVLLLIVAGLLANSGAITGGF